MVGNVWIGSNANVEILHKDTKISPSNLGGAYVSYGADGRIRTADLLITNCAQWWI